MIGAFTLVISAFLLALLLPIKAQIPFCHAIILRLIIVAANVISNGQLPGAATDANTFFNESVRLSSNLQSLPWSIPDLLNGLHGFLNIHAILQSFSGPNFFLGHAFSLLGGGLCLILLAKIWLLLFPNDSKSLNTLFLVYTLTPSVLTNQSYILREVWQSYCILGIAWITLRIRFKGVSVYNYIGLAVFVIPGLFMHTSMSLTIPIVVLSTFLAAKAKSLRQLFLSPAWLIRSAAVIIVTGIILFPLVGQNRFLSQDNGLLETAESYGANSALDSRASYGNFFTASEPWSIVPTFIAYQLAPAPWQIGNISDILVVGENVYRLFLLFFIWKGKNNVDRSLHVSIDLLMLIWIIMELVWSIGTINWGTASRHHVPSYGLLLICGLACKKNYIAKKVQN